MRVFRNDSTGSREIDWNASISPQELAKLVNDKTSRVYSATGWSQWWGLRCSRRLAMEPWAKDLAGAAILRKLLDQEGILEVEEVSATLPLLLTSRERERIRFRNKVKQPVSRPWLGLLLWIFKRAGNRILLWRLPKIWKREAHFDLLIHTVVLPESVLPDGKLSDMFFPGVQAFAEGQGKKVLTFGFAPLLSLSALKWKRLANWVLLDEVIGFSEIKKVVVSVIELARKINEWNADVDGISVEWLKARWMDDLQQTEFFDSAAASVWAGKFCKSRNVACYLYSFERKTFEQAMLNAIHEESPDTLTYGYQNAAVTNKHYHFWSYSAGQDVIPFRILTVGSVTSEWMLKEGAYPPERIRISGALRQQALIQRKALRKPVRNLIALWAEGIEQYDRFWKFLKSAWAQSELTNYFIRIRLHPAISFDFPEGGKYSGLYEPDPLADIKESIDWADAVLYASTSLAILAMAGGTPVLSIRLSDYFDDDCIASGSRMLHWRVEKPADFKKVFNEIESLNEEDFEKKLQRSVNFGRQYFHPATPESFLRSL